MKRIIYSILLVTLMSGTLLAQEQKEKQEKGAFKLETNLSFWAVGGPNLNVFYVAPKRFSFGVQYVAGFEMPGIARDLFFENSDDLTVDWDFGLGLEARYRFNDSNLNKGFYMLSGVGYEGWTVNVTDDRSIPKDDFTNLFWTLGLGYNWYPFESKNFHIGASYNLIVILNNTDDRNIGDVTYNINSVVPPSFFPTTFYAAWRFKNK